MGQLCVRRQQESVLVVSPYMVSSPQGCQQTTLARVDPEHSGSQEQRPTFKTL